MLIFSSTLSSPTQEHHWFGTQEMARLRVNEETELGQVIQNYKSIKSPHRVEKDIKYTQKEFNFVLNGLMSVTRGQTLEFMWQDKLRIFFIEARGNKIVQDITEAGGAVDEHLEEDEDMNPLNITELTLETPTIKEIEAIKQYPHLEKLTVKLNLEVLEGENALAQSLPYLPNLKWLSIDNLKHTSDGQALAAALPHLQNLTHLIIQSAYDNPATQKIADALSTLRHLTHLVLMATNATNESLVHIAAALSRFEKLETFVLQGIYTDATILEPSLRQLPHLTYLRLVGIYNDAGMLSIAKIISEMKNLKQFQVRGQFKDKGVEYLTQALQQLRNLESLGIQGWFKDNGAQSVATLLPQLVHLKQLVINGFFEDDGAKLIASALLLLHNLQAVNIIGKYKEEVGQALLNTIPHLPTLKSKLFRSEEIYKNF